MKDTNPKMLGLSDKDFHVAVLSACPHEIKVNNLEMNGKIDILSRK